MPLAQDRSLDLLASSPARYHCATGAPFYIHIRHNHIRYCTLDGGCIIEYVLRLVHLSFSVNNFTAFCDVKHVNLTKSQLLSLPCL